ncbi:MAG: glycoside hydrolase family 32 protein [Armatimonadetes bacterium]|nr:glycoside hydrolase family 32 protein [Armatimonadota bacterium]
MTTPITNRSRFAFCAPPGTWINDPVPFYEPSTGVYHLYLQHNPAAPLDADKHWLHVSSRDCLSWTNHGVALAPSRVSGDSDVGGVWTGCVTQRGDGVYVALYTAIPTYKPFTQVQCAALSHDLHTWEKVPGIVTGLSHQPEGYGGCFRDPQTFLLGDKYYCIIGGERRNGQGGAAFLYEATDDTLLSWQYSHVLYEGDTATGHDFECPDFFPLPNADKWCLLTSREKSWWHLGTLNPDSLQFERESFGACDDESRYAAKSCVGADGERLVWFWVRDAGGEADGWSGALDHPRRVSLSADGKAVEFAPV